MIFTRLPYNSHRITKNNQLTHLGEMLVVGGRFARVVGFRPPSLHVKSCSANQFQPNSSAQINAHHMRTLLLTENIRMVT